MGKPTLIRAGVIGWPISHSRSPVLHGHWLERYGIDGEYLALAIPPQNLEECVRELANDGFAGANITIPHKETVIEFCSSLDSIATRIGAVNTLVVSPSGNIEGRNTDAYGFLENIRAEISGFDASAGPAVVIGAGGAARAIVAALIDSGAPEIRIVNRTESRAEALARALGPPANACRLENITDILADAALLVNSTSLGMTGQPPLRIDLSTLPQAAIVNDIVYDPIETALLRDAANQGNRVVDGIGMLLHQGRPGFQAWFGVDPEVTPELRAAVLRAGQD